MKYVGNSRKYVHCSRDDEFMDLPHLATANLPSAASGFTTSGNEGAIVYDETTNTVKFCNGSSWASLASSTASLDGVFDVGKEIDGAINSETAVKIGAGSSNNVSIYHSTDVYITANAGDLRLSAAGGDINCADENITTTGTINIAADSTNLTLGASGATDSKIFFDGSDLKFYDSNGSTYTLAQLASASGTLDQAFDAGATINGATSAGAAMQVGGTNDQIKLYENADNDMYIATSTGADLTLAPANDLVLAPVGAVVTLTGALTVSSTTTATGAVYADGGLDRSSAAGLAIGAANANAVTITPATTISGAATLSSTLAVTGITTATGAIYANGGVDRSSAAALAIGASNANAVTVTPATTINNTLAVNDGVTFTVDNNDNAVALDVNMNDTTNNNDVLELNNAGTGFDMLVQKTNAEADGVQMKTYQHSTGAANDKPFIHNIFVDDGGDNATEVGRFYVNLDDETHDSEDASLIWQVITGASLGQCFQLTGVKAYVGDGSNAGYFCSKGDVDVYLATGNSTTGTISIVDGANGNINLSPNGSGEVVLTNGKMTTNSTTDMVLDTNAGTNSGNITIADGANCDITLTPNGTGMVIPQALGLTVTAKTEAATMTVAEGGFVTVASAGGPYTITLPAASGNAGLFYIFKKIDADANAVTLDGNAAETIDGAATVADIDAQYDCIGIICDGSNWHIFERWIH